MTNIPKLSGIVDLVALQNTVALLLLSDDRLSAIPVLTEMKLHQEVDMLVDVLWTTPRSALQITGDSIDVQGIVDEGPQPQVGAGLLVEMPEGHCFANNPTGPPMVWKVHVVAFEDRNVNLLPGIGIGILAEQLVQVALDILHQQAIYGFGVMKADPNAIGAAQDWMTLKPGINAWRCTLTNHLGRTQTKRAVNVIITFVNNLATITAPDPSVEIRYTLDGTAPAKANPAAQKYTAPFPVSTGDLVLVACWVAGQLTSAITGSIAP